MDFTYCFIGWLIAGITVMIHKVFKVAKILTKGYGILKNGSD